MASTTQRSRPSKCRPARAFVLTADAAGFWICVATATAAPAPLPEIARPPAHAGGRAPTLLGEDRLGLGLHVFKDGVDTGGVDEEVRERLAGHVRRELRAGVAVEELRYRAGRGNGLERLLLQ